MNISGRGAYIYLRIQKSEYRRQETEGFDIDYWLLTNDYFSECSVASFGRARDNLRRIAGGGGWNPEKARSTKL